MRTLGYAWFCFRLIGLLAGGAAAAQAQADGTLRWKSSVQGYITLSSPALSADGNTIYIGVERASGGRVVALPPDGIRPRWIRDLREPVDSSPAVGPDGTVYVGCVDGRLYALRPDTGEIKWEVNTGGFVTSSPAIGADGTVYFGSAASKLHAVTAQGAVRWTFDTGGTIDSSPAIGADGTIYFGCNDRQLYAVNPDGTEKWRLAAGGRIFSSPAIGADGTIYVGAADQRLYAANPDGTLKWSYFTNGDIQSSPVLGADGTVYFASADAYFYALNPAGPDDLRLKWRTDIRSTTVSTAVVRADGAIIFGADDRRVRALGAATGAVLWTYQADDAIESSPTIAADGSIYVGSLDGFVHKLNGNGSPVSAVSAWPGFRRSPAHDGRAPARAGSGQLVNLATRARVEGSETLIAGFVVQGRERRAYLLRAAGPALAAFGLAGMADPRLNLFSGSAALGGNDNWGQNETSLAEGLSIPDTSTAVGAFPLPEGSRDAALLVPLPPGLYSSHLRSTDGRGGVVLAEIYDALGGDPTSRLVNLSTRGRVGVGENSLFAGVVVGGAGITRLLLRAVGPGLAPFGVGGLLARPAMAFYRSDGAGGQTLLRTNSGWSTGGIAQDLASAAVLVGAFPLPEGSADCAMVVEVMPGAYTIQVSGVGDTTGEALVEIYVLP